MGRGNSRSCSGEHWFLDPWKFEEVWKGKEKKTIFLGSEKFSVDLCVLLL